MAEKKGAKPAEKKSTASKLVEGVKSAVKSVTDAVTHPKDAVKHAVERVEHALGVDAPAAAKLPTARKQSARGNKRTLDGIVKSDKMDKTVVVEVVSLKRDPVYGKYMRDRERYKAHDETNQYHTGDRVQISEHRPLSRDKRWIVSKLIARAKNE